jgi:hypothetical protein
MNALHINYGPPMEEVHRESVGVRWCFVCRKRRSFDYVVKAPTEPSYYGPSPSIVGECGHLDGDLFPGRYREWVEPEPRPHGGIG